MEYRNLQTLIDIKIANFINEYENTNQLFKNSDVKNGLLHPGEYGIYKELLIDKLLSFALPKKFSYGTGFITQTSHTTSGNKALINAGWDTNQLISCVFTALVILMASVLTPSIKMLTRLDRAVHSSMSCMSSQHT